jgi:hypothetical protein
MIVRLAVSGAVIDVTQNAETKFGIFVEDLPFGHVVTKVSRDKSVVFEDLLDERANLFAALSSRIAGQYTVTFSGKLFECIRHHPTSLVRMPIASLSRGDAAYPAGNLSARLRKSGLRAKARRPRVTAATVARGSRVDYGSSDLKRTTLGGR